jgi:hypothetical protein
MLERSKFTWPTQRSKFKIGTGKVINLDVRSSQRRCAWL